MTIKNLFSGLSLYSATMIVAFSFSSTSFSQENPAAAQLAGDVKLFYNYPADHTVRYLTTNKVVQELDINGQTMQVNVLSVAGCTIKSIGNQDNNARLEITIDTLGQTMDSPGGTGGGPFTDAIGKTFTMIISPEGKEVDVSDAEKIVFSTGSGDSSSVGQYFDDFFPDVTSQQITPGYAWSSTDSVHGKTSNTTIKMLINAENKFEGFEKIGEINCAKITSVLSGTRDIKTRTQGMDIKMYGPFTGKSELYFAPAEGYFIKHQAATIMNGTMEMISPESFTIPLVMNTSSVSEIRK